MMVHALVNNLMNVVYVVVTTLIVVIPLVNVYVQVVRKTKPVITVLLPPLIMGAAFMQKKIMIVTEIVLQEWIVLVSVAVVL